MREVETSLRELQKYVDANNVTLHLEYAEDWHVTIEELIEEGEAFEYTQTHSVWADTLAEALHNLCEQLKL